MDDQSEEKVEAQKPRPRPVVEEVTSDASSGVVDPKSSELQQNGGSVMSDTQPTSSDQQEVTSEVSSGMESDAITTEQEEAGTVGVENQDSSGGGMESMVSSDVSEAQVVTKLRNEQAKSGNAESDGADESEEIGESEVETSGDDGGGDRKGLKIVVVVTVLVAVFVAILAGGIYVYKSGVSDSDDQDMALEATPTPSEPTATPTPEADSMMEEVELSELSIQVLNGSGVIGAASAVEDLLVAGGAEVLDVGNAGNYDYEVTVIQAKGGVPKATVSEIEALLADDYEIELGDALSEDGQYDVVVTVGKS